MGTVYCMCGFAAGICRIMHSWSTFIDYAPINVKPAGGGGRQGMGWGFYCLCWPWGRVFD